MNTWRKNIVWIRPVAAGAVLLALSACATAPSRVALTPASKQKFGELAVLNVVPQDEMVVRATANTPLAYGGGLIGALVVSKVGESAQNKIDASLNPFYASIDDVDARARFATSLRSALSDHPSVKFGAIEQLNRPLARKELDARRDAAAKQQHGLIVFSTSYTFTPDYRVMTVVTSTDLRKPGEETPLFLNTYTYQSQPVGSGGTASLTEWAEGGGARYRQAVDQAAEQLAAMIRLDLAADAQDPPTAPRVTVARVDDTGTKPVAGPQLASGAGRAIVRDTDGHLYSLPQSNGGQQ